MHVIVKFMCLAQLALSLSFMHVYPLISLASLMSVIALSTYQITFIHMLQRMKWLLIILVVIYAFSTPGEYIQFWRLPLRPTYEGFAAGLTQVLNIIVMLAGLAFMLSSTSRAELIGGIYQLLLPLKYLRFNPEKFAVRTWLTMHYAETRKPIMQLKSFDLEQALAYQSSESLASDTRIAIVVTSFRLRDYLLMVCMLIGFFVWINA